MSGQGALFTREDAVEAAWAVVNPVLKIIQKHYLIHAAVGAESGGQADRKKWRLA